MSCEGVNLRICSHKVVTLTLPRLGPTFAVWLRLHCDCCSPPTHSLPVWQLISRLSILRSTQPSFRDHRNIGHESQLLLSSIAPSRTHLTQDGFHPTHDLIRSLAADVILSKLPHSTARFRETITRANMPSSAPAFDNDTIVVGE